MIAAIVPSLDRLPLLRRLLASLRECGGIEGGITVVNNSPRSIQEEIERLGWPDVTLLEPGRNLGVGGGVAHGMLATLCNPAVNYVLVCDDDALVAPGAPALLRAVLAREHGGAAVPMLLRENGNIGWFPGLLEPAKWRVIKRQPLRPEEYLRKCGTDPVRFSWAPWPVMLVSRAAIETVGLPREDMWYQGDDLEYAMRLSARFPCFFVPAAQAMHYPPPGQADHRSFYYRECVGMQNVFYMVFHLPHCRRALRHLPGNCWRFLRNWHWSPCAVKDLVLAAWRGAVRRAPGGAPGFTQFQQCYLRLKNGP
ncbi:MAG: glycosyltransferase [Opitutaceae bacterium]|nr:glycosyltransferase [Opitutaceae bacterium]